MYQPVILQDGSFACRFFIGHGCQAPLLDIRNEWSYIELWPRDIRKGIQKGQWGGNSILSSRTRALIPTSSTSSCVHHNKSLFYIVLSNEHYIVTLSTRTFVLLRRRKLRHHYVFVLFQLMTTNVNGSNVKVNIGIVHFDQIRSLSMEIMFFSNVRRFETCKQ